MMTDISDGAPSEPNLPLMVILDTNVWRETRGLRSPLSSSLIHYLDRLGGRLGLPEVVESEVMERLVNLGTDAVKAIWDGFDIVQDLVGTRPDVDLPSSEQLESAISAWLDRLDRLIDRSEVSIDQVRRALSRVNRRQPPIPESGREEFRDCLIWEAVLDAGLSSRVVFVTHDGGYFQQAEVHPFLLSELEDRDVLVVRSLRAALELLQGEAPPLDERMAMGSLVSQMSDDLTERASNRSFLLGTLVGENLRWFSTEDPDRLALTFELVFELDEIYDDQTLDLLDLPEEAAVLRSDALMFVHGECLLSGADRLMDDLKLDFIKYEWSEADGTRSESKDAFLRASDVLGRRTKPLIIRKELD